MKKLILTVMLILPGCVSMVQASEKPVTSASQKTDTEQTAEDDTGEEAEPAIASPDRNRLKDRNLGEAFQEFRPSEEISADNPVPFPVDI